MGLQEVSYKYEDGHNFRIFMDKDGLKNDIDWAVSEYEERDEDDASACKDYKEALSILERTDWEDVFSQIKRKKNRTFKINSVTPLVAMRDFGYDSEEHYGFRYPEIRLKAMSDLEAHVELAWTVDKY